jgi:hypothetical protein
VRTSYTQINTFCACRRLWELKYKYGIKRDEDSDALTRGKRYHEKLAEAISTGQVITDEDARSTAMVNAFLLHALPSLPEIVAVEKRIDIAVGEDQVLTGYIDGVTANNKIVEHKTTQKNVDEAFLEYENSDQAAIYCNAIGSDCCYYTIIRTPTIRQKNNETIDEYIARCAEWYAQDTESKVGVYEVKFTSERLQEELDFIKNINNEIENATFLYKNKCHCYKYGNKCEYAQICELYKPGDMLPEGFHENCQS